MDNGAVGAQSLQLKIENRKSKIGNAFGCCCAGIFCLPFLWMVSAHFVMGGLKADRENRMLCDSNRCQLIQLEEMVRRSSPAHGYVESIPALREEARKYGGTLWNGLFRCPSGGHYSVDVSGDRVTIYCSVFDHPPVSNRQTR